MEVQLFDPELICVLTQEKSWSGHVWQRCKRWIQGMTQGPAKRRCIPGRCQPGTNHGSIWVFPKIGVPPNHPFLIGFSIINHPNLGYPYFWKHPYMPLLIKTRRGDDWRFICFLTRVVSQQNTFRTYWSCCMLQMLLPWVLLTLQLPLLSLLLIAVVADLVPVVVAVAAVGVGPCGCCCKCRCHCGRGPGGCGCYWWWRFDDDDDDHVELLGAHFLQLSICKPNNYSRLMYVAEVYIKPGFTLPTQKSVHSTMHVWYGM